MTTTVQKHYQYIYTVDQKTFEHENLFKEKLQQNCLEVFVTRIQPN